MTNRRFRASNSVSQVSKNKTIIFFGIVHLDLIKATGTCKVINLASGISSAGSYGDFAVPHKLKSLELKFV
jgi:hypothetical protein